MKYITYLFSIIFKVISGYYFFVGIFNILIKIIYSRRKLLNRNIYLKEFTSFLNEKTIYRLRLVCQFIFTLISTSLIFFILLYNLAPLGITVNYSSLNNTDFISEIGPKERILVKKENNENIYYQTHDLVYFSTLMPYNFDTALVKIIFQNPDENQTIALGFQDQEKWHYETQIIDAPFLNSLTWNRIGDRPYLYQNKPRFSTIADFLHNLPKNALIGTYDTSMDIGRIGGTVLKDYQPKSENTTIDVPLRGRHTMYAYLKDEPFHMTIQKQDLNWYEDPDPMTVKIYKGNDLVYQAIADDDGITDKSGKTIPPQEVEIKNPGKEFPESGVYKVVIDANSDTVIKKINTNLHKIVFSGSIFPVANNKIYGKIINSTSATTVYTNALVLGAVTYHTGGLQRISVGDEMILINNVSDEKTFIPKDDFTKVILPRNDVFFKGYMGYFSFEPDHFFLPTPYYVIPLTSKDDLDLVDYVLTDYVPNIKEGDWQITQREFDIRTAIVKNGRLSWIIHASHLEESSKKIKIKSIEITFKKKSWF